ncbi:MAG TPA: hypothetical protein DF613_04360, partial [Lachnospiraceae bacterium]|nr:hypothetical protein [Lachnospiraceae bacterium]
LIHIVISFLDNFFKTINTDWPRFLHDPPPLDIFYLRIRLAAHPAPYIANNRTLSFKSYYIPSLFISQSIIRLRYRNPFPYYSRPVHMFRKTSMIMDSILRHMYTGL